MPKRTFINFIDDNKVGPGAYLSEEPLKSPSFQFSAIPRFDNREDLEHRIQYFKYMTRPLPNKNAQDDIILRNKQLDDFSPSNKQSKLITRSISREKRIYTSQTKKLEKELREKE